MIVVYRMSVKLKLIRVRIVVVKIWWTMNEKYTKTSKTKYPFRCKCGGHGFVDMGIYIDNRYPCYECYMEICENRRKANKNIESKG